MRSALVLLLVALVGIVLAKKDHRHEWENWKADHEKNFNTPEEEAIGFENFKKHDAEIDQQNERYAQGKSSWQAGHNSKSHLSHDDLAKRNGFKPRKVRTKRDLSGPEAFGPNDPVFRTYTANPASVTITDTFYNTTMNEPVQDQGQCGNCYSFAGGSMLSSYYSKYFSINIVVSRQEIVDCSIYLNNGGCNGGDPRAVLEYYILNKTVSSSAYPFEYYTPKNVSSLTTESCQTQKRTGQVLYGIDTTTYNMMDLTPNELTLKSALKNCGAVAVSINAEAGLSFYQTGTYTCNTTAPNDHAVTLIGWSQDANGSYWIIKNSWGTSWGMKGYFRLAFGSCGITDASSSVASTICPNTFS